MSKRRESVLGGALILSAGAILAKLIGVFYRIPLTNLLKSEGMGLYQLVFPYYVFLLTVSTTGLPAAISGVIGARLKGLRPDLAEKTFRTVLLSLALAGGVLSAALYLGADRLAALLDMPPVADSFRAISPAVFLVCVISAFRGRFSGYSEMAPTAVSQVIEQAVKAVCCLYFAAKFMPDVGKAVTYSVASVTISESVAACYLAVRYLAVSRRKIPGFLVPERLAPGAERSTSILRAVYALSIPVTLSALLLPATQIADGFFAMKFLDHAVAAGEYGLFTGPVSALVSFPTVFAQSLGLAIIPGIAGKQNPRREIASAFKLTFFVAIPCTAFLIFFADSVVNLLYGGLSLSERGLAAALLRIDAVSVIGISLMQMCVSVLVARGKASVCTRFMGIAAAVKVLLSALLIPVPGIGIFGAAISGTTCFLLAGILDLGYIIREKSIGISFRAEWVVKPLVLSLSVPAIRGLLQFLPVRNALGLAIACLILLGVFVLVFLESPFLREEKSMLIGRKHAQHHRARQ